MPERGFRTVIGITGGLATGKTTVAGLLARYGAYTIDADKLAHEVLAGEDVKKALVDYFGKDILSPGGISRRRLAEKAFGDDASYEKLCGILHPLILRRMREAMNAHKEGVLVIDAPLLIETGLNKDMDITVVVTASEATQIERAGKRGMIRCQAENIIKRQMPVDEKVRFADFVVDTDRDMEEVKKGVEEIWKRTWKRT